VRYFETTYGIIEYIILLAEIEKKNNLHLKMLERLAESGDSRWQRLACLSIPKFNNLHPKMIDLLGTLAHDKDVSVLETTGQTLGALSKIIPKKAFEILSLLVHNPTAAVKSISVQSLLRLPSSYTDKIIPFLLEVASDYRWEVCKELALHLLSVNSNTKAFVPVLEILSKNGHYQVRKATAEVLKTIGPRILPDAIQLLKNMCEAAPPEPHLSTVIYALATLSNYDKVAVSSIFEELSHSPKEDVKRAIVEHVAKVDRYIARKIWDNLVEDSSIMVRMAIWQAMVKTGIIEENDSNALQSILLGRRIYQPGILFTEIKKRDETIVPFDISKISNAIFKAAKAIAEKERKEVDSKLSEDLANRVVHYLYEKKGEHTPTVEEVQDAVERILIKHEFSDTAKAYILYRQKRNEERKRKKKKSKD
jgi:HEAT repeat protein